MKIYEKNAPECECEEIHTEAVERKKARMPDENTLYDLSDFFKILGDSTRINILFAIDGEAMCVCDIAEVLGMSQSAISHQLRVLKQAKLVRNKRDGKQIIYSLDDAHISKIISMGLEHVKE